MTKAPLPTQNVKTQKRRQNVRSQKIANRLRAISWSNFSHQTVVINQFTGLIFQLPKDAALSKVRKSNVKTLTE